MIIFGKYRTKTFKFGVYNFALIGVKTAVGVGIHFLEQNKVGRKPRHRFGGFFHAGVGALLAFRARLRSAVHKKREFGSICPKPHVLRDYCVLGLRLHCGKVRFALYAERGKIRYPTVRKINVPDITNCCDKHDAKCCRGNFKYDLYCFDHFLILKNRLRI